MDKLDFKTKRTIYAQEFRLRPANEVSCFNFCSPIPTKFYPSWYKILVKLVLNFATLILSKESPPHFNLEYSSFFFSGFRWNYCGSYSNSLVTFRDFSRFSKKILHNFSTNFISTSKFIESLNTLLGSHFFKKSIVKIMSLNFSNIR